MDPCLGAHLTVTGNGGQLQAGAGLRLAVVCRLESRERLLARAATGLLCFFLPSREAGMNIRGPRRSRRQKAVCRPAVGKKIGCHQNFAPLCARVCQFLS